MRIAFSTLACPDWTWDDILTRTPAWGYHGVEIRLLQRDTQLLARPEFQASVLSRRTAELERANFRVAGLGSSVRFDYLDAEERARQVETGCGYIDLAHHLRADFVRVFGDVWTAGDSPAGREQVIGQVVDGLLRLGDYAARRGVRILMETHGDFANTHAMRQVMERCNHPAVGTLWDTHHPWRFFGEDLRTSFETLKPWIGHTHWKDSVTGPAESAAGLTAAGQAAEQQASSLMSGHRPANYVLFGQGEFPAVECLQLLDSLSYDGWYSLEWEHAWHPELPGPEVALPVFPDALKLLSGSR